MLSDSALVAIIEREFIAVLVRNNVGGEEAQILKEYDVPAWNYRVVRFVDASGKDLIPRKDPVWESHALSMRMRDALIATGREVPVNLKQIIGGF